MKNMKYILSVIALGLLLGCSTTFRPWKLSEVKEGMDRAQVIRILGEPNSVETKDGAETLLYTYSEDYNPPPSSNSVQSKDAVQKIQDQKIKNSFK
jgi:outer membrane protein assembly factor BamE (lipoprotein component of BamABCDE complex)